MLMKYTGIVFKENTQNHLDIRYIVWNRSKRSIHNICTVKNRPLMHIRKSLLPYPIPGTLQYIWGCKLIEECLLWWCISIAKKKPKFYGRIFGGFYICKDVFFYQRGDAVLWSISPASRENTVWYNDWCMYIPNVCQRQLQSCIWRCVN